MNRTDRLYALVEELRATAPRPRSARALAERFEVSARTIERDILALQESGVPIYAETGRLGGYTIDRGATLPPLNFTAPEMAAIAVALARAENGPFAAATHSALRKVQAVASAARTEEADELMDRVRLVTMGNPALSASTAPVPLAVQNAITARQVLRLRYRDRTGAETEREVEPVAFIGSPTQWYLMTWCRMRQGPRVFRMDRIRSVVATGEPAPHRSYADLDFDIPDAVLRRPDLVG
ncbi:MAG TPA: YafY family protein [Pseudonocardiaceae bacterium]|jgi:predicted DNA-binding transcriptional regulator YafY|nr:YafY family protein [Pseudonocardiaceae bacterium]